MIDKLIGLVSEFSKGAVVENSSIPNEMNANVIKETGLSIVSSLKNAAMQGDLSSIAKLFDNNAITAQDGLVQKVIANTSQHLSTKFGLDSGITQSVAMSVIPNVLNSLVNKAKDPKDNSFQISEIINSFAQGNTSSSLMSAISNFTGGLDLDANGDGKVDLQDAIDFVNKKGGIKGIFNSIFGK